MSMVKRMVEVDGLVDDVLVGTFYKLVFLLVGKVVDKMGWQAVVVDVCSKVDMAYNVRLGQTDDLFQLDHHDVVLGSKEVLLALDMVF